MRSWRPLEHNGNYPPCPPPQKVAMRDELGGSYAALCGFGGRSQKIEQAVEVLKKKVKQGKEHRGEPRMSAWAQGVGDSNGVLPDVFSE